MTPEIPRDIIVRARQGHRDAFRRLIDSLASLTYNLAWRMTYNSSDADDLTQEIFLRLHRHLDKYDASLPFLPWFRTLATNVCLNHLKKARNSRAASLDANEGMEVAGPSTEPPAADVADQLRRAVQDLPEEYRMVVTYLYFHDLSVQEIAETMQIPTGTVKTWLFRARDQLKNKLKPIVASQL